MWLSVCRCVCVSVGVGVNSRWVACIVSNINFSNTHTHTHTSHWVGSGSSCPLVCTEALTHTHHTGLGVGHLDRSYVQKP